jgi:hypothetical protein
LDDELLLQPRPWAVVLAALMAATGHRPVATSFA